jgi:Fic family protein
LHAALLVPRLEGLDREIVRALLSEGATTQVRILNRVGKISPATLSRAVSRLVDQGVIEKSGTTRNAEFRLSPAAQHFARPAHLRPPVPYDPARIDGYVPNETRWLPPEAEARMREAAGKLDHRLDASTYSKRIAERFLIDLAWASSHLEGNTYEYLEAEALIKFSEQAQGHDWTEATMILNHKRAIILLLEGVDERGVEPNWMFRLHSLSMRDLLDAAALGRVRDNDSDIRIGGSCYKPLRDHRHLSMDFSALCWAASEVENPFEASFLLLAGTAYLQAFSDGNKRVGRLSCNLPLLRAGLPPHVISRSDPQRVHQRHACLLRTRGRRAARRRGSPSLR